MDGNNLQNLNVPGQQLDNPLPEVPKKKLSNKIIAVVFLVIIAGLVIWMQYHKNNNRYLSYDDCVAKTELPCKHYFVGDLGSEWRPSPYQTKEDCEAKENQVGTTCIVPPGSFKETRWISSAGLPKTENGNNQSGSNSAVPVAQQVLGLVYAKYDNSGEAWSAPNIVLLNTKAGATTTIANFTDGTIDDYSLTSGFSKVLNNLKGNTYFFYIKNNADGKTSILFKADSNGKILDQTALPSGGMSVAISALGDKAAWCGGANPPAVTIHDFSNNANTEISDQDICGLNVNKLTFSKDGSKLYYVRGFYELMGDYTAAQVKQLAEKGHNGVHVIEIATKKTALVFPIYDFSSIVFWNDPSINYGSNFIVSSQSNALEIRKLTNANFDYLTPDDISKLPIADTLKIPNQYSLDWLVTEDGKGIFYNSTEHQGYSSNNIGYYDIENKQNYFPLPDVQGFAPSVTLVAAIDKSHLYYLGGIQRAGQPAMLYQTDYQGNNLLVDRAAQQILKVSIVNLTK